MREEESDPTPRSPQISRWPECRCLEIVKGCSCNDDGSVTHGGVHHEGFEQGCYTGGEYVTCDAQTAACSAVPRTPAQLQPAHCTQAGASWRGTAASSGGGRPAASLPGGCVA